VLQGDVVIPLDEEGKQRILGDNLEFASQGKRVLACGYAQHTEPGEDVLKGMIDFVYVGLVVMMDPPRPEVSEAIKQAHQAWIRVIMITGDNLNTAKSIWLSIGLEGKAYEGAMLDTANPHDLLIDGAIFARVNPSHKVLICKTLQEMGHRVIMTGDGVNDAPALKQADVGVAMAITGSDVSKEVADIVLRDDNFASIVSGIKEGRIIYNNIKNFVTFLLSVNFDEILLIMISIFVGRPLPMTAIQILWINLVTDGLPTIALGFDEGDPDVMNQPPRSNKEMILSGKWPTIIVASLISASVALLFFWYELDRGEPLSEARTALVTISILVECLIIFSIRSWAKPFWTAKTNRYLIGAILISVFLHIGLIYSPRNAHFGMSALDTQDRYWIIWLSFAGRVMMELYKMIVRKLK
jgi:Ca2+-transporting ATPase